MSLQWDTVLCITHWCVVRFTVYHCIVDGAATCGAVVPRVAMATVTATMVGPYTLSCGQGHDH